MSAALTAQLAFGARFPDLLGRMHEAGFDTKIDETGRGAVQAEVNALTTVQRVHLAALVTAEFPTLARAVLDLKPGVRGIRNSLHVDRCAGDVILFKDGEPVWEPSAYKAFGDWWNGAAGFSWGGDFGDYDHFSRPIEGDPRR